MNTKAFFPCGGGSNLILATGMGNQIFFSKNSSLYQVFSPNSQKMTLWHKKLKSLPTQMDFYNSYMVSSLFPRGIIIFQGVLTKFNFLMKSPHLENFANLMKGVGVGGGELGDVLVRVVWVVGRVGGGEGGWCGG